MLGGRAVRRLELCFLDEVGVPVLVRAYLGSDNLPALEGAQRLPQTHTTEVWEGKRKVARVKKEKSRQSQLIGLTVKC